MLAFTVIAAAILLGAAGLAWLADLPANHDWTSDDNDH